MSRYSDMSYFMSMDAELGVDMIEKAIVESNRDKLYQVYVQQVPFMSEDNFISFNEYYKAITSGSSKGSGSSGGKNMETDKEVVMNKVEDIMSNNIW